MRKWGAAAAAVVASTLVVGVSIAPSEAASSSPARQTGKIVSQDPADNTPDILDGTVSSIAQVGDEIVVGGTFTQVMDKTTGDTLTRRHAFAFNAATGAVSLAFDPAPNGIVNKVLADPDGSSVLLGGSFHTIAGANVTNLAKLSATSGALDGRFHPPALDRPVLDIENVGPRLWVAGRFTHVGTVTRGGIVALDPTSGSRSSYFDMTFKGLHNPDFTGGNPQTFVKGIAVNPAGTELVAIGNFTSVDGQTRVQVAKISLGRDKAVLSPWTTPQFRQRCSLKLETNMTDVQYSPSGSYFVVSSAGGYGGPDHTNAGISGCDVVTRFSSGTSTHGSRPAWTAYSGGDTTWTVEVTDNVVYLGGHMRWENNPDGDNVVGPGAVDQFGIAALDPLNGLPYSWNPGRHPRGVGVQDMLATDDGLYVGSDTEKIGPGNQIRKRIAMLPLAGGRELPRPVSSPGLQPATVYTVKTDTVQRRNLRQAKNGRFVVSGPSAGATGTEAPDWSNVVGAFMIRGDLYTGERDGTLTKRTFDGNSYGAPTEVNAGDALVRQDDWHGVEGDDAHPGDVPRLTSIFYYHGFLYYTLSGSTSLYKRAFEIEDDLVGQLRSATTLSNPDVHGAFVAGGKYFFAGRRGYLSSMEWGSNGPTGNATAVSGPRASLGSQNWASKVAFVYQPEPTP